MPEGEVHPGRGSGRDQVPAGAAPYFRRMGVHIHTARRRISQLLDALNAETRFQAGAQAILRGRLDA
nr:hypothetical protein OG781_20245 [Streptomyces sp. NBC_00830]